MADRYWVGGSGPWNATSTANWSTTSGGAGGASVPTYADNVIFDSNSSSTNYTVDLSLSIVYSASYSGTTMTVSSGSGLLVGHSLVHRVSGQNVPAGTYITSYGTGTGGTGTYNLSTNVTGLATGSCAVAPSCADLTVSTQAAGVTLTVTSSGGDNRQRLHIYGSFSLPVSGCVFGGYGLVLCSPTTGKIIATNSVSMTQGVLIENANGTGGWTLGTAYVAGNSFTIGAGTFSTNGYAITLGSNTLTSTTTAARTINLGASTISSTGSTPINFTATGMTLNAGTSTITTSANGPIFNGGGLTFYNVTFSAVSSNPITINGANTFNNLTFGTRINNNICTTTFTADQTVTGLLTINNPGTITNRRGFRSDVIGVQRTITAASIATTSCVDFRDIVIAGAAAPLTGTSIGNAGNNSGITFSTPKTVYWNLAAGGNWISSAWATASGGTPSIANYPLPQDTAIFQDTGISSGSTITASSYYLGTIDFSTRTLPVTFTVASGTTFFGPVTLSTAVTVNGTAGLRTSTFASTYSIPGSSLAQVLVTITADGSLAITGAAENTPFRYVLSADGVLSGVPVVGGPTRADIYNFLAGLITTGQSEVNPPRLQHIYNLLLDAILSQASIVEAESITLGIYVNTNFRMERLDYLPQELPRVDLVIE